MTNTFDIVNLIEKNQITHLSNNYQHKLILKIKEHFTSTEQQLFVASFYCLLTFDKNDFVIDLKLQSFGLMVLKDLNFLFLVVHSKVLQK